ncbi:nucleolin-like [Gossypium australe]|uniref:Nucleolin-like n=1 Tax=Gossypium australe TaxID=47621 RepID=A0A5B6W3H0_9ROSI|nr:nucleolin-like [Gossypium australe]
MENELAGLSLDEEEDAVLQIQIERTEKRREEVFSMDLERVLKGCLWTFNNHLLWGEDPLRIPLVKAPFCVQIHDIPIGFFSKNLAIQLGNFIKEFMEYDGSNLGKENRNYMRIRVKIDVRRPLKRRKQILCYGKFSYVKFRYERLSLFCFFCRRSGHNYSFCDAKMMLGTEVAEMGWDLSLRAQSRRAVTTNSVWLREEEDGKLKDNAEDTSTLEIDAWTRKNQVVKHGESFDPVLGFNLEGRKIWEKQLKVNQRVDYSIVDMEQDKEDGVLIGEEGKKHARGEMGNMIVVGDEKTTAGRNRIVLEGNQFISTAAKRQADRSQ